jgi:hypothetical protein
MVSLLISIMAEGRARGMRLLGSSEVYIYEFLMFELRFG